MGHDSSSGPADGVSTCRAHAELWLGKSDRNNREGEIRRHHCGFRQSAERYRRNGTREVCDEGRAPRPKRVLSTLFSMAGAFSTVPIHGAIKRLNQVSPEMCNRIV